jgi:DNA-binding CsgD family transcriptional regulator
MNRDWMDAAACTRVDPELFFSDTDDDRKAAIKICQGCPVLAQCRADTLATDLSTPIGVRAGLTGSQRRRSRQATHPKITAAQRKAARETARTLLAQGAATNAQVARQLGVGESTVSRWRREFQAAA